MNLPLRPAFSLILASILLAPCWAAGLNWEVRERQVSTTAGGEDVSVKFPFVNSSSAPVSITHVDTGCVCTAAKPSKTTYAPGEHGELAVEFTLGGRVGRQERLLTVTTSEAGAQPQELHLVVDIAELITVRPRLVFWAVGDPAAEKTATISLARPALTRLPPPTCSSSDFIARLAPTDRPDVFQLLLTPTNLTAPTNGVVRVEAVIEGKVYPLTVFAAVR